MNDQYHLEPGIYRLTEDAPAYRPDKRVKHDWRALPMKAGMLFRVRPWNGDKYSYADLSMLFGYAHDCIRLDDVPFRHKLERVTNPTATEYLAYLHGAMSYPGAAGMILDRLMAQGLLTTAAIDRMLAEDDAEAEAEAEEQAKAKAEVAS